MFTVGKKTTKNTTLPYKMVFEDDAKRGCFDEGII